MSQGAKEPGGESSIGAKRQRGEKAINPVLMAYAPSLRLSATVLVLD